MKTAKTCGCGRSISPPSWRRLPTLGVMRSERVGAFELRNCSCGSTLAAPLSIPPSAEPPDAI